MDRVLVATEETSAENWLPWLTEQLERADITTEAMVVTEPVGNECSAQLQSRGVTNNTVLIGHGLGAECILTYLSDNPQQQVEQTILVEPRHHVRGTAIPLNDSEFSQRRPEPSIMRQTGRLAILYSANQPDAISGEISILHGKLPGSELLEITEPEHTEDAAKLHAFPQLLDTIALPKRRVIEQLIAESDGAITRDYRNNEDISWASCVGSRVFILEELLPKVAVSASIELYRTRMKSLGLLLRSLHTDYPYRDSAITQGVKEDVLRRLNILSEDYPPLTPGRS